MSSQSDDARTASTSSSTSPTSAGGADGQKPKRLRTSKPKVKTGCTNCKQRRIKCDEKRPSCTQCVRSKRPCTGYPPPPRSARAHEVLAIAPKPGQLAPAPLAMAPSSGVRALQPLHSLSSSSSLAASLAPRRLAKFVARRPTPPATPTQQHSSVVLYRPVVSGMPFDQLEGMYFDLFRLHTANELSGFFDSVFWSKTVLQECQSEAAIRHAVVALGALYKTLEKSSESPPGSPSDVTVVDPADNPVRHWEVAVKQYSHACKALMGPGGPTSAGDVSMGGMSSDDGTSHRTRLMATVLLACFDSFIGDHKQAIIQIQTGLRLLEKLRQERRRAFASGPAEPVEEELIQMFTRLAIQAKSYDMAFHFPQPYVIRLTQKPSADAAQQHQHQQQLQVPASPQSSDGGSPLSPQLHAAIPDMFATLLEARLAWDTLCEKMMRFNEQLFSYQSVDGPMGILPAVLKQYGMGFKSQIEAWSAAFDHILASRTAPGVSSQEKAGIAVLKMFQIMGQILFLMTFSDSELQFDTFHGHFKAIVELGTEVVGDEERRASARRCPDAKLCNHRPRDFTLADGEDGTAGGFFAAEYAACHIKPSFSADLGIVPPLFVVATKCRHPLLRRQAIQLLRSSSRREGMWDSELTARIGMWIADIEEQQQQQQPSPSPAPAFAGLDDDAEFHHRASYGSDYNATPYGHHHRRQHGSMPYRASSMTPPPSGGGHGGQRHSSSPIKVEPSPHWGYGSSSSPSPPPAGATPSSSSVDFADHVPLGPGGNARWDGGAAALLRPQRAHATASAMAMAAAAQTATSAAAAVVPEARRVMVRRVEFDLRERRAVLECGTRGLGKGKLDGRARTTHIHW